LLDEGFVQTFDELLNSTDWNAYGRASGNPKCRNCMMHCGYEPTAVSATFGSLGGLFGAARSVMFGSKRRPAAISAGLGDRHLPSQLPVIVEPKHTRVPACHSPAEREPAVVSTIALLSSAAVAPTGRPDMILERR